MKMNLALVAIFSTAAEPSEDNQDYATDKSYPKEISNHSLYFNTLMSLEAELMTAWKASSLLAVLSWSPQVLIKLLGCLPFVDFGLS